MIKPSSFYLWTLLIVSLSLASCSDTGTVEPETPSSSEITIGNQVWMTKNLDVSFFRNGDSIPHAATTADWYKAGVEGKPAWCYYNNNAANGPKYGKLYNWFAVNDSRGLAPAGYHIPTDVEWSTLIAFLGGESMAGEKMKSKEGWLNNGNGNNGCGFFGVPAGMIDFNGLFYSAGELCNWWSSTESTSTLAWKCYLGGNNAKAYRGGFYKTNGFSVRCIKD